MNRRLFVYERMSIVSIKLEIIVIDCTVIKHNAIHAQCPIGHCFGDEIPMPLKSPPFMSSKCIVCIKLTYVVGRFCQPSSTNIRTTCMYRGDRAADVRGRFPRRIRSSASRPSILARSLPRTAHHSKLRSAWTYISDPGHCYFLSPQKSIL